MKRLFVISLVLLLSVSINNLNAQRRNWDPEEAAKRQTEWMKTELSLTDEQLPKVEEINLESAQARSKVRQENQGNWDTVREEMRKVDENANEKLKKVLTEDQFKKYVEIQEKRREERRKRMEERRREGGGDN